MKIVEVSQSHVFGRGVGWLGWLGWSDFFYRLILRVDYHDKPPYKISTQYLKAFKSYPIVKVTYWSGCLVTVGEKYCKPRLVKSLTRK